MHTGKDVAALAGVSQATVSRTFSFHPGVRSTTRAKVWAAAAELRYTPNEIGRAMRTGLTNTVGVVIADIMNPFYPELLEALGRAFNASARKVVVWNASGGGDGVAAEAIRSRSIDGVVFTTVTNESRAADAALQVGCPIVLLNRTIDTARCDTVLSDNFAGGRLVADYFVNANRTQAAYIGGLAKASTSRDRESGFRTRLGELGMPLEDKYITRGEFSYSHGFTSMLKILSMTPRADAVFCANDIVAFGALDSARTAGVNVPGDIWVVGFDDTAMSSWDSFQLTTVRQQIGVMAAEAARLLLRRIRNRTAEPTHVVVDCSLIVRHTSS